MCFVECLASVLGEGKYSQDRRSDGEIRESALGRRPRDLEAWKRALVPGWDRSSICSVLERGLDPKD